MKYSRGANVLFAMHPTAPFGAVVCVATQETVSLRMCVFCEHISFVFEYYVICMYVCMSVCVW